MKSVSKEEIRETMIERGECDYDEINVGNIRPMRNRPFCGMDSMPACCSSQGGEY